LRAPHEKPQDFKKRGDLHFFRAYHLLEAIAYASLTHCDFKKLFEKRTPQVVTP
jgi:hypothetical protein